MHKLVVLYPMPTDPAAFVDYYTNKHLPLAATLPGLEKWNYSTEISSGTDEPAPFFAIFEAEFADESSFGQAMESEVGQAVTADVKNYATGGAQVIHFDTDH